jgi:hypothetical protein
VIRIRPAGRSEAFFRDLQRLIAEGKLKRLPPKEPGTVIYVALLFREYQDWTRPTGAAGAFMKAFAFTGKALGFKL